LIQPRHGCVVAERHAESVVTANLCKYHSAMRMSGRKSVAIFELLLRHIHSCVGGVEGYPLWYWQVLYKDCVWKQNEG
jgi:hypothetical protein